jgi:hypothetical protein
MSYIEATFISRKNYDELEPERKQENEYEIDEFYVAMFSLASNPDKFEAAKLPLKFKDVARLDSGLYLSSLALFNSRLESTAICLGEFSNGYWIDVRQKVTVSKIPVLHSYIRDYDTELDSDLRILTSRLSLVA